MHRPKGPAVVSDYIRVRLKFLYNEKTKNNDPTAHMVLDKAIYELGIVLDLIKRTDKNNL